MMLENYVPPLEVFAHRSANSRGKQLVIKDGGTPE